MNNEKFIEVLNQSCLLDDCEWVSMHRYSVGKKYESLLIFDESFPVVDIADGLLCIIEDMLGKEKFHDLLVQSL